MLGRLECRVDVVANGVEVLGALEKSHYDIVFMDMMMPEMNGLEATKSIRSLVQYSNVVIVALTSDVVDEVSANYLDAGINEVLARPVKQNELTAILEKLNCKEVYAV